MVERLISRRTFLKAMVVASAYLMAPNAASFRERPKYPYPNDTVPAPFPERTAADLQSEFETKLGTGRLFFPLGRERVDEGFHTHYINKGALQSLKDDEAYVMLRVEGQFRMEVLFEIDRKAKELIIAGKIGEAYDKNSRDTKFARITNLDLEREHFLIIRWSDWMFKRQIDWDDRSVSLLSSEEFSEELRAKKA